MKSNRLPAENPVYSRWGSWADSHAVSFFQTPAWGALLEAHFPEYSPAPIESRSSFIPLMRLRRWGWLSDSVYGMPMMTTGGFFAENIQDESVWDEVFGALTRVGAGAALLSLPTGMNPPSPPGGFSVETGTIHLLDLSGGWEATWRGFDRDCRQSVTKAQRSEVFFERAEGEEAVEAHWEVVRNQFSKWKPNPEPTFDFVRDLCRTNYGRLYRATQKGRTVVSLLAFAYAGEVFFWQSARCDGCPRGATNLLYSEVVRLACEEGFQKVNFGGSLGNRRIEKFKEDFGAVKTPYHLLKWIHPLVSLFMRRR